MISNLTALLAAREHALPGARAEGVGGRAAAVYCSDEAHHSVVRAVETCGLGSAASAGSRSTRGGGCASTRSPRRWTATPPRASSRSPWWPPRAPR